MGLQLCQTLLIIAGKELFIHFVFCIRGCMLSSFSKKLYSRTGRRSEMRRTDEVFAGVISVGNGFVTAGPAGDEVPYTGNDLFRMHLISSRSTSVLLKASRVYRISY